MDLKEAGLLDGHEDRHWYYAGKSEALLRSLGNRPPSQILDVGAGSGLFSKMLLRRTPASSAVCVDPGYEHEWSESHVGKRVAFRRSSPVGQADLVLMMDVIEHVDDDLGLVRQYACQARPGTRFVLTVPAFSWLWSPHDVFLEHRRRYTLAQTLRVMTDAGLSPVGGFYFYAALFPAVVASRLWRRLTAADRTPHSDLRRHHAITNALLTGVCRAESAVARHNRAFGLTAFGVAEKA